VHSRGNRLCLHRCRRSYRRLPRRTPCGHAPLDFMSEAHLFNIAGHALVGCASAVANRGRCGSGALSGAVGSFAGPLLTGLSFESKLVATSVLGGLASVAGGGKFANGAITAAFGYLFNEMGNYRERGYEPTRYTTGPNAGYVCADICSEVGSGWSGELLGDAVLGVAAAIPVGIGRALYALVTSDPTLDWTFGSNHSQATWENQMQSRGWTEGQITDAIANGESFPAQNNVNPANSATRYVSPETGQSVVIDNVTREVIHIGGPGFRY